MKRKYLVASAVAAAIVLAAGPAFAFDCVRVSSSTNGLVNSQKSGHWEYISVEGFTAETVASGLWTAEQGECVLEGYLATGQPTEFAVGLFVANGQGGVIAGNNPDKKGVLSDGKGIDHLEAGILPALFGVLEECGAPNPFPPEEA
jgi:hypothetical protein